MGFGLTEEEVAASKTDAYIVDRLRAALHQLKQCRSEEERVDYHTVLTAVAPTREAACDTKGMIAKVASRLRVEPGSRYVKTTGEKRPYAFDNAITRRTQYDEAAAQSGPLQPGQAAISRGQACTVLEIDYEADTCKLGFSTGGVEIERDYTCIYKGKDAAGKGPFPKGSARLRRAPPSVRPKPREERRDAKAEAARPHVEKLFDDEGARSPAQRDQVRRRVGRGLYQTAQALIVYAKYAALYSLYLTRYTANHISFSLFKKLRPWYVRRAKQESCLCKPCENFKGYQTVLHSLPKLFEPLLEPPPSADADAAGDDDDEAEADSWVGKAALLKLLDFCKLQRKSDMVKAVLCTGAFDGAGRAACINGTCPLCGFATLWSKGLRRHVVDKDGNVLASAPKEFESEVKWMRIRSSKVGTPGEAKQTNYEAKTGTLVQFLDEFERDVMRKYPHHRFIVSRTKATAAEFDRNRGPGWVQSDVDFAMDGEIPPPGGRAIQSDHWSPMSFTLFVQVVSWLDSAAWKSRDSELSKNTAVTVEPAAASTPGSIHPAKGSYWAEVIALPSAAQRAEMSDPERLQYGVRRHGASDETPLEWVERRYLRHRKLHTKAFINISDDKTHDSHAAQTFIEKTIAYLEEHYVQTGKETFFAWHMHSDNAPSHFKSSKTMHYLTLLPSRLASWASGVVSAAGSALTFRVFWEFGAPGHGKGVWDGIGAWIKRTVRQDIVDHRPEMKTVLTSNEQILSPAQVAEHAKVCLQ